MKEVKHYLGIGIGIALVLSSCQKESDMDGLSTQNQEDIVVLQEKAIPIPGQYIIEFNEKEIPQFKRSMTHSEGQEIIRSFALEVFESHNIVAKEYKNVCAHAIKSVVTNLSLSEIEILKKDARVKHIEQDQIFTLKNPGKGKPGGGGGGDPVGQTTPWGITAIGGSGDGAATGNKAWIIDSGIDLTHPDLNVDVTNSMSFLSGNQANNPNDQNGHGSHVAGTVGAIDNGIGVVGVAEGVTVVSVRVLDRRGSGSISGVIAGVNYVAANASTTGDVANMSLGGGISTALDAAVLTASSNGIKFVLAAGNSSQSATLSSPARVDGPNIYTISAMDNSSNWASFSNFGSPVDYCAPGVSINSTYKNGGYSTLSGTSMAAPHVTGILILGAMGSNLLTVNGDPDSSPDPIAHR